MDRRRRQILIGGIFLFALIALVPPWRSYMPTEIGPQNVFDAGYHPVWIRPNPRPGFSISDDPYTRGLEEAAGLSRVYEIDFQRLLLHWVVLVAAVSALMLYFSPKREQGWS